SEDGMIWSSISKIPGAINSIEQINYNFIDRSIPQTIIDKKTVYYKLSQTDYDGTIEYFNVIPIQFKNRSEFIIKKTNLIGQDIDSNYKGIIIELWSNGYISKSYQN
ncbi:hypothetical protein N9335_02895, partial [Crocinitomicaceae bacterium]|nr:hypothetical protein [Crocinitomicaceae bacterium]